MKPPENIHRFNVTALELFRRLYDAFPDPIELNSAHAGVAASPADSTDETYWAYRGNARNVVTWLAQEGFLRYESQDKTGKFYDVRLTLKGLTVLGHVPTAVKDGGRKSPVIDSIKRVLASGAEKAGTEAVKSIVGAVFKLSLQYGMSGGQSVGVIA